MLRSTLLVSSKHALRSLRPHSSQALNSTNLDSSCSSHAYSTSGPSFLPSPLSRSHSHRSTCQCGALHCGHTPTPARTFFTASRATLRQHNKPSRFPLKTPRRKHRSPFYIPSKDSPYYHLVEKFAPNQDEAIHYMDPVALAEAAASYAKKAKTTGRSGTVPQMPPPTFEEHPLEGIEQPVLSEEQADLEQEEQSLERQ
mmetsp:Transcript_20573/g.52088  ORF Transcript_20573/g.52088 Transcript_20573/m.52088 type:complete len:199 (+) Transcript_20573:226-822(+)|eukprot:CAMPEP_0177681048 /NCGR_PEP_ID=MMETSP0447-20121125/30501_1 /TAXON_ID=0 /ORGANISM="Stygamoeba regulata, Strain BSH-02190019" /LENGTH=198 /DNA_ID=CAMNT_0019190425 /DNA_START=195 /DNA_END=791 /DNA_ORIENTATION=+